MEKLKVELENCFGIGKLSHEFDFSEDNTHLIYAPNGTMKTSFARTLDLISKNNPRNQPCDRIYKSRSSKFEILVDDVEVNPDNILVVDAEDNSFDASSKISMFLASKELKNRYDEIYLSLNNTKGEFIKKLKVISQSTDCEKEFVNTFSEEPNSSFFELLLDLIDKLKDEFKKAQFRYNDVFDKKNNVKKFLDKNQDLLDQYLNNYKNIISKSNFFKESTKNSFGTYQASLIMKSIEDDSFFDAGHKFVLEDGTSIENSDELKKIVLEEIENILNDEKLKQTFDKVDKAIGANVELRSFKRVIDNNNLILVELKNYEEFKKNIWINYFSELKQFAVELIDDYKEKKEELDKIIKESKKEFALWSGIVMKFNSRFHVPFEVRIINQEDIILKQETANLEFIYSDNVDEPVSQKRDSLLNVLSKGEQRAYFMLQFLFEIESRKLNPEGKLLIFDDIADSFDYKNKFAIIEYIKEIHELREFNMIVLTHNFDFYRTIASRLYLSREVIYMATKSKSKVVTLHVGQYVNDIFAYFIRNHSQKKFFISLISFVRNLIEYSDSKNNPEYLMLTSCLHKKESSGGLTANTIFDIYKNRLVKLNDKIISFGDESIIPLILNTADSICDEDDLDEIIVENKIPLAIAIRLKTEEYIIAKLPGIDLNTITKNQTQELCKIYKETFPVSNAINVLEKVNLMTPENIHINAFMFEPLIDMSVYHLIDLYREVISLS